MCRLSVKSASTFEFLAGKKHAYNNNKRMRSRGPDSVGKMCRATQRLVRHSDLCDTAKDVHTHALASLIGWERAPPLSDDQ